jgi:hypothetical protein
MQKTVDLPPGIKPAISSPHMPPALEALRLAEGLSGEKPGRA